MTALFAPFSSLRRRPGRTLLTALGTALGIATIVALLAVADGAEHAAGQFYDLGASDLGLFQRAAADPTTSVLSMQLIPQLRRTPGIVDATPLLLLVGDVPRDPGAIVFGADPHGFLTQRLVFFSGHMLSSPSQIVVGDQMARQLHLSVGDTVSVHGHRLTVVGIYHIGIAYQDAGAFVDLPLAQSIAGMQGETTTIAVKLALDERPAAARRLIARRFPGLTVIADGQEASRAGANAQLVANAALVIAVLALLIGGIGVINTMLMSVVERRTEFALLSAVGWSRPQVAARVLVEGVVTTVIGAAIGIPVGVLGASWLVSELGAQEFVAPRTTAWGLGRGLLVGVLIGVLGGLYPAWRAARVSPAQVLAQG
ncbi:MAG TPA: ABC transporter permease [Solirubrobacteraceae bacterium]|nr:ABC transporter permease [Solirubrobacteraceae bacterium]